MGQTACAQNCCESSKEEPKWNSGAPGAVSTREGDTWMQVMNPGQDGGVVVKAEPVFADTAQSSANDTTAPAVVTADANWEEPSDSNLGSYFRQELEELRRLPGSKTADKLEQRAPYNFSTGAIYTGQWMGN